MTSLMLWPAVALGLFALQYRAFSRLHPNGTAEFVKYLLLVLLTTKLLQVCLPSTVPMVIAGFELQFGSGGLDDDIGFFVSDFLSTPPSPYIALFLIVIIELLAGVSARAYLGLQQPTREAVQSAVAQWWANLVVFVAVPLIVFTTIQFMVAGVSGLARVAEPASGTTAYGSGSNESAESRREPIRIYDVVLPAMQFYGLPQSVLSGLAKTTGAGEGRFAGGQRRSIFRDIVGDAIPWFLLSALLPLLAWSKPAAPTNMPLLRLKIRNLLFGSLFDRDAPRPNGLKAFFGRLPWRGTAVVAFGVGFGVMGVVLVLIQVLIAHIFSGFVTAISAFVVIGFVLLFLLLVGIIVAAQYLGRKR